MTDHGPIERKLRAEIAARGPIGLDRYMSVCLTDPDHGYYTTKPSPIGAHGDFITAPEISQIFGELVGLWLVQCWLDQGAPDPFALVELGPGRGVLMHDALRAARAAPAFLAAARPRLVEASEPLRKTQAARLSTVAGLAAPIEWRDALTDVEELPLFLVANEFFDALPIRQWRRQSGAWLERRVGDLGATLGFVEQGPIVEPDIRPPGVAPADAVLETAAASCAIAATIGARLGSAGGGALLIDYGYTDAERARSWTSTLQAVRRHAYADPFHAPGSADLTAHVAFDDIARAAVKASSDVVAYGPAGQGSFLLRLGAAERAAALAKNTPGKAAAVASELHRLTEPDAMGAVFRAMALLPRSAPAPAGFDAAATQL